MSDQSTNNDANNAGQPAVAQLRILTQYVKDLSFENPNAPQSLGPVEEQPNISVRVDVGVQRMSDTDYEVSLKLGADAKTGDKTMFLVELDYAGLFRLTNIPEANLEGVLVVECPRQIFPFARRIIGDLTRDGGFPPLMIDPIDFVTLYQQRRQQMAQEPAGSGQPN
ncbi:protein-export chaperone SecB [uncultured Parvibaculum sp.]|uniref:protein-export chaperone SecB n=1 Tax=uncultured Parvibaculum sp. TaxID=291828 RepID=UPI0030DD4030|tara:strand:- start:49392 stop:49892 length:501 start_codon:yes stop_codon:yes gene_type:complete